METANSVLDEYQFEWKFNFTDGQINNFSTTCESQNACLHTPVTISSINSLLDEKIKTVFYEIYFVTCYKYYMSMHLKNKKRKLKKLKLTLKSSKNLLRHFCPEWQDAYLKNKKRK